MLLLSVIGLIENKGMGLTREVPELAVVLGCIALHLLSEAWRDHSTSSGLNASALNYDALWRFCAMDFSASGQKRRLCRRSTRTLMANLPFQSHHRYAISLSFPTTQVCYRVQSKDVRFHFGVISCWSARSQCVRLARPTRCPSSPARPVY